MDYELKHRRWLDTGEETIGGLFLPGKASPEVFVLEDEARSAKVPGEMRIPAGRYEIRLRAEGTIHASYLKRFGPEFHKGTLHLQNVPGFQYILIHIGNTDADTLGCLLVADQVWRDQSGRMRLAQSTEGYRRLYVIIRDWLTSGNRVYVNITDNTI